MSTIINWPVNPFVEGFALQNGDLLNLLWSRLFATQNEIKRAETFELAGDNYGAVVLNVAALVTVQLPAASSRQDVPVFIADIGGNAKNFNATILPFSTEKINGLGNITLTSNFGSWWLFPIYSGGWIAR